MNAHSDPKHDLEALVARLICEVPDDQLSQRVASLCQGHFENDDRVDHEWASQFRQLYSEWLRRLKDLELSYQERVDDFVTRCQTNNANIPQLFGRLARIRIERTLTAITEFFESVMPVELLSEQQTEFTMDVPSCTGWWSADCVEPGLELPVVIRECLATAGEFDCDSVESLCPIFTKALLDGTLPLPGFRFQSCQDSVTTWSWMSPDFESTAESSHESWGGTSDIEGTHGNEGALERSSLAFQFLTINGDLLRPDAADAMTEVVSQLMKQGITEEGVVGLLGRPLGLMALCASVSGDVKQFKSACSAMEALTASLEDQSD